MGSRIEGLKELSLWRNDVIGLLPPAELVTLFLSHCLHTISCVAIYSFCKLRIFIPSYFPSIAQIMSSPSTVDPIPPVLPASQQPVEAHEIPVPDAPSTTIPTAPLDNPEAQTQAPTASIDPNKPSVESAPTALPTNPATHPEEQKEAVEEEHPQVIKREVEKTKAEERDLKGEKPQGTVVAGIEDDRLWAMLRRFDTVSAFS